MCCYIIINYLKLKIWEYIYCRNNKLMVVECAVYIKYFEKNVIIPAVLISV